MAAAHDTAVERIEYRTHPTTNLGQMHPTLLHVAYLVDDEEGPFQIDGGQGRGEDQGAHGVDQILFHRFGADDKGPHRSGSLAKGPYQKVNIADDTLLLGTPQSEFPPHTEGMRLVEVEVDLGISPFQGDQPGQIAFVSVHAENALGDDEYAFILVCVLGYQPFQLLVVVVPIAYAPGFGEPDAVDYTRMDQFVGQYQRAVVGHGRQDSAVGMVAAVEDEGAFGSVELGQPLFESGIGRIVTGEQTRRGGGEAAGLRIECLQKLALQRHVVGQSQIVVRREIQHGDSVAYQIQPLGFHLGQPAQIPVVGEGFEL